MNDRKTRKFALSRHDNTNYRDHAVGVRDHRYSHGNCVLHFNNIIMEEGTEKGEVCNRDGCQGIIAEHEKENGCSCHINPPCSSCTTPREYCPECEWDAHDEQNEAEKLSLQRFNESGQSEAYRKQNEEFDARRRAFYALFHSTEVVTEFQCRTESHTHFSQKVIGMYPGENLTPENMKQIRGTFGGRFEHNAHGRFVYIAYTD